MPASDSNQQSDNKLKWWQLSLLGVACTVGTGFFLASRIAIEVGGPAILLDYLLAALGAYLVFDKLARMTAETPLEGSFRSYAKKAFGRWAGFSSGWMYWSSELLIMGSQLTALSLFSQFWFPQVPMWCFAAGYDALGLLIIFGGTKGFERMENAFAVMKLAAVVMFLVIATLVLSGVLTTDKHGPAMPGNWFPVGAMGVWSALIFAFYSFGGLEVVGLMAVRLKKPEEAPKAGTVMLLMLTFLYVASLAFVLVLEPWKSFTGEKSPFVIALADYRLPFVPHLFNGILIVAGFSTMTASMFAVTSMVATLAKEGDAPPTFATKADRGRKGRLPALGLTAGGMTASVVFALLMPKSVYEYITTAAGLMLLYNWLFILVTSGRLLKTGAWGKAKQYAGIGLISLAVAGTWLHGVSRPGFWISLGFVAVIGGVTLIMQRQWNKHRAGKSARGRKRLSEQGMVRFEPEVYAEADQRQAGRDRYGGKEPGR
ncbi:amino acid permease [Cohnella hashimotonis]|uniref:Amino acid permease n=1 Tax=Cohnella hashimotonis TaxID=2826895 RepID=A0ABT6TJG4_9BACL|nr:amino acid permease [Cohnella hashimotonis]MDI4646865.1 amino acid permease [Cohnella hashimotonis]